MDGISGVVFVASLSSYNETLLEEPNKNAMLETLELFDKQLNSNVFEDVSFILFLNKYDIFCDKISNNMAITEAFPDYDGNKHDPQRCYEFIKTQFTNKNKNSRRRQLIIHRTTMTDMDETHNRSVFDEIFSCVINPSLSTSSSM